MVCQIIELGKNRINVLILYLKQTISEINVYLKFGFQNLDLLLFWNKNAGKWWESISVPVASTCSRKSEVLFHLTIWFEYYYANSTISLCLSSSKLVEDCAIFFLAELTRSIVEDLSNGRSPTLQIDQFSSYCTDASGNWLDVIIK